MAENNAPTIDAQNLDLIDRLKDMDPEQQRVVVEIAALLITEPDTIFTEPGQLLPEVDSIPLIDRLHLALGANAVVSELLPSQQPQAMDQPPSAETPKQPAKSAPVRRFKLYEHNKTPANMRNFLSRVMPESVNDDVFDLPAHQSSMLSYGLIEIYTSNASTESRKAARTEKAGLAKRHIGLYAEPQDNGMIALAKATSVTDIWRRITNVEKTLIKEVDHEAKLGLLEAVRNGEEGVAVFLEQYQKSRVQNFNPELLPIPEGFQRQILRDNSGNKHVILWNTESLEIIVDGKSYATENKSVPYQNRLDILQCLMKRRNETFSSNDLHLKGVARTGKQTTGAVKEAIRQGIVAAEEIVVSTSEGDIPILGRASPRKYQLNAALGGPAVDPSAFKNAAAKKKVKTPVTDTPAVQTPEAVQIPGTRVNGDNIVINGNSYPLFGKDEPRYLRELIDVGTRMVDSDELAGIILRTSQPSKDQVELVEEVFYGLSRRGLITEEVQDNGAIVYRITQDVEEAIKDHHLVELYNQSGEEVRLHLTDFDIEIIEALLLTAIPLRVVEISRRINPNGMDPDEFDELALTIKKYFYPLGIVSRDYSDPTNNKRFYLPDDVKEQLQEILGIIKN